MVAQANAAQSFLRTATALATRCTGKQQSHLHIGDNALVRNKVVALEYKTNRVIAICVPVAVAVTARGASVNYQVTLGVLVKAANDVEQRGFAAARLTKDAYKLLVSKRNRDALERRNHRIARNVVFSDSLEFKHVGILGMHRAAAVLCAPLYPPRGA